LVPHSFQILLKGFLLYHGCSGISQGPGFGPGRLLLPLDLLDDELDPLELDDEPELEALPLEEEDADPLEEDLLDEALPDDEPDPLDEPLPDPELPPLDEPLSEPEPEPPLDWSDDPEPDVSELGTDKLVALRLRLLLESDDPDTVVAASGRGGPRTRKEAVRGFGPGLSPP